MLTRKHFQAAADIIKQYIDADPAPGYDKGVATGVTFVAEDLADYFASENPNFNRARFIEACGITVANAADCPRHGGPWGADETCETCVDDNGVSRPKGGEQ